MALGLMFFSPVAVMFFSTAINVCVNANDTNIYAILSFNLTIERNDDGVLLLHASIPQKINLIGENIDSDLEIAFTPTIGDDCVSGRRTSSFRPTVIQRNGTSAEYEVTLSELGFDEKYYFLCIKHADSVQWQFIGDEPWLRVAIMEVILDTGSIFPVPLQAIIIVILLFLSGLFSGLNLGLMALDKTELQIIERCGSENEKRYAKTITPFRKRGNFLLCTLLLGNVMVNNTATILLDDLSNGIIAVVVSTMCIVVFGEIIPQAVCSRHGLAVGAKTAWITRFFMLITFPLSFPISLLLDKVLGEEIGQVYDKEKLQELIRMTADHKMLQNDEANIIAGALQLSTKCVEDVMTKMEDVYLLDVNTILDFEAISEILKSGYTRVPVYDGDKKNIVHLLNTKELALIDPDDNTLLKTVCSFYNHKPMFAHYDMRLDQMLQEFLQGSSHLAIVQHLKNDGDLDQYYEDVGVVTLEDVIEEIIQSEIVDETDILTDNRKKKPRQRKYELEYDVFDQKQEHGPRISQQLAFVAYQFLSTAVEPFKEPYVARSVLKQLIRQNIFVTLTPHVTDMSKNFLFTKGVECDYFILILEGHVEVRVGKEDLTFECGPFNYFGGDSLTCLQGFKFQSLKDVKDLRSLPPYHPDYSLRAVTILQFLRIRRVHYLIARRTTSMMFCRPDDGTVCHEDVFTEDWHRTVSKASNMSRNNSAVGLDDGSLPGAALSDVALGHSAVSSCSLIRFHGSDAAVRAGPGAQHKLDDAGRGGERTKAGVDLGSACALSNCTLAVDIPQPCDPQDDIRQPMCSHFAATAASYDETNVCHADTTAANTATFTPTDVKLDSFLALADDVDNVGSGTPLLDEYKRTVGSLPWMDKDKFDEEGGSPIVIRSGIIRRSMDS